MAVQLVSLRLTQSVKLLGPNVSHMGFSWCGGGIFDWGLGTPLSPFTKTNIQKKIPCLILSFFLGSHLLRGGGKSWSSTLNCELNCINSNISLILTSSFLIKDDNHSIYLLGFLWKLYGLLRGKKLGKCLAQSKHSINAVINNYIVPVWRYNTSKHGSHWLRLTSCQSSW